MYTLTHPLLLEDVRLEMLNVISGSSWSVVVLYTVVIYAGVGAGHRFWYDVRLVQDCWRVVVVGPGLIFRHFLHQISRNFQRSQSGGFWQGCWVRPVIHTWALLTIYIFLLAMKMKILKKQLHLLYRSVITYDYNILIMQNTCEIILQST